MSVSVTAGERAAWTVRAYQPEDLSGILALFEQVFRKPVSEAFYRWKVLDSPWPIGAPTVWVAAAGARIVGHYGGTAMRFQLGGQELRVVHGCDVMTASDFRRHGVLTAVGDAAHAAWATSGVGFVIGLPNQAWGSRRYRLGCQDAFPLLWLRRVLRPEAFLARRLRLPSAIRRAGTLAGRTWNGAWDVALCRAARTVEVVPVEQPDSEFDLLWERLRREYAATVIRDRAWVHYRYADAPEREYCLLLARRGGPPTGYLAYRLSSSGGRCTGWIADLFSAPQDGATRAALLHAALKAMHAAGAEEVRALAPRGTPVFRTLRRAGFLRGTGSYDAIVIPLAAEIPWQIMRDPHHWLVAAGDFDVL